MKISPTEKYGAWTGRQISEFLQAAAMPMRLAFQRPDGLAVAPLWFCFANDTLIACSLRQSLVVRSLQRNPQIAFDISTNDLPYRGVRGNGTARCVDGDGPEALEAVLAKYVSQPQHPLSTWLQSRAADEVAIVIHLERLSSWDFTERMAGIAPLAARAPDALI